MPEKGTQSELSTIKTQKAAGTATHGVGGGGGGYELDPKDIAGYRNAIAEAESGDGGAGDSDSFMCIEVSRCMAVDGQQRYPRKKASTRQRGGEGSRNKQRETQETTSSYTKQTRKQNELLEAGSRAHNRAIKQKQNKTKKQQKETADQSTRCERLHCER